MKKKNEKKRRRSLSDLPDCCWCFVTLSVFCFFLSPHELVNRPFLSDVGGKKIASATEPLRSGHRIRCLGRPCSNSTLITARGWTSDGPPALRPWCLLRDAREGMKCRPPLQRPPSSRFPSSSAPRQPPAAEKAAMQLQQPLLTAARRLDIKSNTQTGCLIDFHTRGIVCASAAKDQGMRRLQCGRTCIKTQINMLSTQTGDFSRLFVPHFLLVTSCLKYQRAGT